jgi:phage repressor protein C with HTH and peptisase S24 domain
LEKISKGGYSSRLREIRETLDLNIAEFTRQLDVPRSTLVGWEGEKGISIEVLKPLETIFNVNIDWLLTGKGEMFSSKKREKHPLIEELPEDYYVGRIKGTSMTAAGIPDGVLVLIRISDTPRDGAIQVVEHQREATLKRMREVPGKGWKICFDDHTGRFIPIGPGDEFHIQGDFIAFLPE